MGRRSHFDLGSTAKGASSAEADLRSFTRAFVLITAGSGANIKFTVEASPSEFGSAGDWYEVYLGARGMQQIASAVHPESLTPITSAGDSFVYSLPLPIQDAVTNDFSEGNLFDCLIPRRIRIKNTGGASDADFTSVQVEAHQRRA